MEEGVPADGELSTIEKHITHTMVIEWVGAVEWECHGIRSIASKDPFREATPMLQEIACGGPFQMCDADCAATATATASHSLAGPRPAEGGVAAWCADDPVSDFGVVGGGASRGALARSYRRSRNANRQTVPTESQPPPDLFARAIELDPDHTKLANRSAPNFTPYTAPPSCWCCCW